MIPLKCIQQDASLKTDLNCGIGWLDAEGKFFAFPGATSDSVLPIVWVPTAQVLLLSAKVPGKSAKQWRQALPYALEDQLAEPVEQLHFAVYHRQADGTTYCAVVNKQKMQQWVETVTAAGYKNAMLLPDIFQLPTEAHGSEKWQGLQCSAAHQIWLRHGSWQGFATSMDLWPQLQSKLDRKVVWIENEALRTFWQTVTAQPKLWQRQFTQWNLRQGEFQARSLQSGQWQKWAWPIALGLAIFTVSLGKLAIETHWMQQQAAMYQQQSVALFHQLFPQVKRIVNLKVQAQQQLQALQKGSEPTLKPVQFLKQTAPVWTKFSQVKIQQLQWQDQKLVLQVQAQELAAVNQLVHALQQKSTNLAVNIQFKVDQIAKAQVTGKIYVAKS